MSGSELRQHTRADYRYFLTYRTRWSDNDQYSHMNNAIYYHLFDSVVNTYLIEQCGQDPARSPLIGLVVSSFCQFFAPLSFPQTLDLGLRVTQLGTSSVTYEVGVFASGTDVPAAVGGYTHVFVGSESRKSMPMAEGTKVGLERLFVGSREGKAQGKGTGELEKAQGKKEKKNTGIEKPAASAKL